MQQAVKERVIVCLGFLNVVRISWRLQFDPIILFGCSQAFTILFKPLENSKFPVSALSGPGSCF